MVSKERLAGFVDAIVAVVMTIMLLEFRIPESGSAIDFLRENVVYMIAYILSFIYVATSWFNQQFMLRHAESVTRRIYVATMLWVLSLSLLPVLAAWTGRTINLFYHFGLNAPRTPAFLFLIMIFLWGIAFNHMAEAFIKDNPKEKGAIIRQMEVYQYLHHPVWLVDSVIAFVIIYFYPPFVFIYTAVEMLLSMIFSRNEKREEARNS